MVELRKVGTDNFYDIMRLSVAEDQRDYVAPNDYSLAEAYAVLAEGRFVQPFGIYADGTLVGFTMIGHDSFAGDDVPDAYTGSYYLWRLMIDYRFQGQGYGREAVKLLLDYVRSWPDGIEETCAVSYEPCNSSAKRLYDSFGFVPNGDMDDDEEIAVLRLR